ncbi:hypothetical protein SDC9_136840 [bioreactor metagenome]|uniref:Uncharacterized protein n=1 Tax=bioreactor metagenome TaxID=1076179 RepID=A0A645DKY7_9ZZZZ
MSRNHPQPHVRNNYRQPVQYKTEVIFWIVLGGEFSLRDLFQFDRFLQDNQKSYLKQKVSDSWFWKIFLIQALKQQILLSNLGGAIRHSAHQDSPMQMQRIP